MIFIVCDFFCFGLIILFIETKRDYIRLFRPNLSPFRKAKTQLMIKEIGWGSKFISKVAHDQESLKIWRYKWAPSIRKKSSVLIKNTITMQKGRESSRDNSLRVPFESQSQNWISKYLEMATQVALALWNSKGTSIF